MLTVDRDTGRRSSSLDGNMTSGSKNILKMFNLLTVVSKLEELTRTCNGKRHHVVGQNATEMMEKCGGVTLSMSS